MAHFVLFFGSIIVAVMDSSWHGLIVFGLIFVVLIDALVNMDKMDKKIKELERGKSPSDAGQIQLFYFRKLAKPDTLFQMSLTLYCQMSFVYQSNRRRETLFTKLVNF
ncbi:MAG: hypothetical protein A3I22_02455 [Parcubacteria group bacterium RIFCSPLOWO2_02_FULL_40_12]|nr:MAG: hypothetical protein A3I22_02455 [Parcubacteria group bacterium RIFCSPLOWO2_02_FULL_40_12]